MKIAFSKYQATGNDFVIIDNRQLQLSFSKEQIEQICHRKFGVGADGLMLIENHPQYDFKLEYYNSDGSQSLCGNGSRAAVQFAFSLGIVHGKTTFEAYDGPHEAEVLPTGIIRLKMNPVDQVTTVDRDFFINTGSPHYVQFVADIENHPIVTEGARIRYSDPYKPGGTNVNFVKKISSDSIFVRTYERGVEDETLSCGTGVTAAALAASQLGFSSPVKIKTLGGDLQVEFKTSQGGIQSPRYTDIFLVGPAKMVFQGELEL
jgi:diaminopimelate epimerase